MRYGESVNQVVHPANPDPNCACGLSKCDPSGWVYCDVTRLARASGLPASVEGSALSLSEQWIAEFDAIAAHHRREAKRRAGGAVSIEGGAGLRDPGGDTCGVAPVGIPDESAPPATPSDLDSPTPPSASAGTTKRTTKRPASAAASPGASSVDARDLARCIANIPTTAKRVAHQCRNRAKYGPHCALHAVGQTPPDLEQFPAALVEQPDNLPFAHDD